MKPLILASLLLLINPAIVIGEKCTQSRITEKQREDVLTGHNQKRLELANGNTKGRYDELMDKASNMREMKWNCDLEYAAQAVADTCEMVHSSYHGENLLLDYVDRDAIMKLSVERWWDEFKDRTVGNEHVDLSEDGKAVGHATAMAWAKTDEIGCGISTNCDYIEKRRLVVACHYKKIGNMPGANMYEVGEPCTFCSMYDGATCNSNGLCVGGEPPCENIYTNCKELTDSCHTENISTMCRVECGECPYQKNAEGKTPMVEPESDPSPGDLTSSDLIASEEIVSDGTESEVTGTEVAESEETETEVPETDGGDSEENETEVAESQETETEVPETDGGDSEENETEVAESQETETEVPETDGVDSEENEAEVTETDGGDSEENETEVAESEETETEVPETDGVDSEENETEVTETDGGDSEETETEVPETDGVDSEENETEVTETDGRDSEENETEVAESEETETEVPETDGVDSEENETEVTETDGGDSEENETEVPEADGVDSEEYETEVTETDGTDGEETETEVTESEKTDAEVTESEETGAKVTETDGKDGEETENEVTESEKTDAEVTESEETGAKVTETDGTDGEETETEVTETDVTGLNQKCPESKITGEDRAKFLNGHNKLRSQLAKGDVNGYYGMYPYETAGNMRKMEWDCDLEKSAQDWANKCRYEMEDEGYGMSIVISYNVEKDELVDNALQQWWAGKDYMYGNRYDESGAGVNFQKVGWAKTNALGCGINSNCPDAYDYVVCHYRPREGGIGTLIYNVGAPCSMCSMYPGSNCENNLCVGGVLPCEDNFSTDEYCYANREKCERNRIKENCKKTCGLCDAEPKPKVGEDVN